MDTVDTLYAKWHAPQPLTERKIFSSLSSSTSVHSANREWEIGKHLRYHNIDTNSPAPN